MFNHRLKQEITELKIQLGHCKNVNTDRSKTITNLKEDNARLERQLEPYEQPKSIMEYQVFLDEREHSHRIIADKYQFSSPFGGGDTVFFLNKERVASFSCSVKIIGIKLAKEPRENTGNQDG